MKVSVRANRVCLRTILKHFNLLTDFLKSMLCTCISSNNHPHLQLVFAHNLLALRLELGHVPRTAHIAPRQPRPPLLAQPDERVRRERGRVDERRVSVLRHRERQLGGYGPGVHCDGDEPRPRPLRAVLDVEELRESQQRELARLGGEESQSAATSVGVQRGART